MFFLILIREFSKLFSSIYMYIYIYSCVPVDMGYYLILLGLISCSAMP